VYGPLRVALIDGRVEAVYSVAKRGCVLYLEGSVDGSGAATLEAWVPGWPLNKARAKLTPTPSGLTLTLDKALGACAKHAPVLTQGEALTPTADTSAPAHPLAVVGSYRAFFYKDPNTAPMKKFIVAGDPVEVLATREGFTQVRYTGKRGVSTGWIRDADLQLDTLASHPWRDARLSLPAKGPTFILGLKDRIERFDPLTGRREVLLKTPGAVERLYRGSDGALYFSIHNRAGWAFYYWPPKQAPARWPAMPHPSERTVSAKASMMPDQIKTVIHNFSVNAAGWVGAERFDAALVHDCWIEDDEGECGNVVRETPRGCYVLSTVEGLWKEEASCPTGDAAPRGLVFTPAATLTKKTGALPTPEAIGTWSAQRAACGGQCVVLVGEDWGTTAWTAEVSVASLDGAVGVHMTLAGYSSCRQDRSDFVQFSSDTRFLVHVAIPFQRSGCLETDPPAGKKGTMIHVLAGSSPQPRDVLSIKSHTLEHVDMEQIIYLP